MYYAIICSIAIIIHLITNKDIILRKSKSSSATMEYRSFLDVVLAYYITDVMWGVFDAIYRIDILYYVTVAYHVTMALTVVFWCRYVISYLVVGKRHATVFIGFANIFFLVEMVLLVVNFFIPLFFWLDPSGEYNVGPARYVTLVIQDAMFFVVAILAGASAKRNTGALSRRHMAVFFFCIAILLSALVQIFNKELPLYTIGVLVGTVFLHVYVHEDEKEEFTARLEQNERTLKETTDIISRTGYGMWKIYLSQDGHSKMVANDVLKGILGASEMDLSPEEFYVFYHSRLADDVGEIERDDYLSMKYGEVRSRTLTWNHPTRGMIYLSAGGTSYRTESNEDIISGYCADVTVQKKNEDRANRVIKSLARSYEFLNYIRLDNGSYVTYNWNIPISDEHRAMYSVGDVGKAISFSCEQRMDPAFRKEMEAFADLSTIDERMGDKSYLVNQFKDNRGLWHEWAYIVAERKPDGKISRLIWAVRKIDDEKQAEIRRQRILEDNIAANKAKTMFLQNMSHEIRTPLNAMFGFSQLLGLPEGTWSPEERDQYNRYIYNSYNMLDMLIGDIIDIADSEHGNYRIQIDEVAVNAACRNALMSVEFRKPANVEMYFTSDLSDDHRVTSDGRRIQQVLINYLTNACKHTREGEIHLHCSSTEHQGRLTFSVTDTGEGVPEDKADVIFNRFTKLNQFVQGSGLGLNICLMIAEKLGGEVYLDTSYHGGARFVFVIDDQ